MQSRELSPFLIELEEQKSGKEMDKETEELYKRLQEMYELMSHTGFSEDVEQAIFSYEDCVTEEDYKAWYEKYSYYNN